MHLFDQDYFADHAYYATFDLVGTVKNVGEGKKPDPIEFNAHDEDKKLCPLECIRDYTNLTKSWRVDGSPSKFFLPIRNHIIQQASLLWLDGLNKLYFLQMLIQKFSRHTP